MATFLLIIIFIVFIGLGLPDSAIGAAWPALHLDLGLKVGLQSLISACVSLGTVLASLFSAKLVNKFGTPLVASISTVLSGLALLGFSLSNSIWLLLAMSIPLGFGAGAIDAALNNYVATHYKSSQMNFLHSFYGMGVTLSPYIFSFTLYGNNDWRSGFRIIFIILIAIAIISFASIPLWKKVAKTIPQEEQFTPVTLKFKEMAKMPMVRTAWVLFFSTCALEFLCGTWGCTFLVKMKNITEANGAKLITLYYVGIALGRFLSGLVSKKISCGGILTIGFALVFIGVLTLFLPISPIIVAVGFLLIGLGNGPTFPNLTHVTPIIYGKERSQSIIGTQMASCNLGILIMYALSGPLFQAFSFTVFPIIAMVSYFAMILSFVVYEKLVNKQNTSFYKM